MTGYVKTVVLQKGFAFIVPDTNGSADIFAHCSQFGPSLPWDETLTERRVEFDTETANDGRTRAVRVRPVGGGR